MVEGINNVVSSSVYPKRRKTEAEIKNYALGGIAAYTIYKPAKRFFTKPFTKNFLNAVNKISTQDNNTYKMAFTNAFQYSKLNSKGVTITDLNLLTEANAKPTLEKIAEQILPKSLREPKVLKNSFTKKLTPMLETVRKGKNACYAPNAKTIIFNSDKISIAAFHEMGHALNHHSKGAIRLLVGLKSLKSLAPLILLTAAFKNKKAKGEKPVGIFDKITTFVKDNCGILTTATLIPTVLEEGLASIRGSKAARPFLDDKMYKQLNKFHGKAWLTYAAGAIAAGFAVKAVSWVQDKIANSKA